MPSLHKSLLAAIILMATGGASAQDSLGFDSFAAGVRVVGSTSIYDGGAAILVPVPNLGFGANEISTGIEGIRVPLYVGEAGRLEVMLRPRFAPYAADESARLTGMERGFTADLGLRYAYATAAGTEFSFTALSEVTGDHDGQELELRLSQSLASVGVPVAIFSGLIWQSDGLSEFLYGVLPSEAMAGRPAYTPGETVSAFIGISTLVPLTDRLSLTGAVRANLFPEDIVDSPIVAEDMSVSGTLGLLWRF